MQNFDNLTPPTTAFIDSENNIQDIQTVFESGSILVTPATEAVPVVPIGEATTPKFDNIPPWVGKFLDSENNIIDLLTWLTSGAIKVQVTGGVAPSDIAYVTVTDVTNVLPNSFPLSDLAPGYMTSDGNGEMVGRELEETANQINITNRAGVFGNSVFSLSDTLILPGTLTLGGDLNLLTYKITSASGTAIQLIPDNDADGIDLASTIVRAEQDIRHAGDETNKVSFTTAAQTYYIGGTSIFDINASGFRLGMGSRILSISNSATASSASESMTASAIQIAIANQIGSAKSFRGGYNASTNLFPVTGGSGVAGAVLAGDVWVITTGGTLGGTVVSQGDTLIALVDTPGQTAGNWSVNANGVATWGPVGNSRAGVVRPEANDYPFNYITGLPATATSGKLMRGTGSAWAETTATYPDTVATNDILIGSGTNAVSSLATDLSSALTTDEFGGLRWTNLGLGQVLMGSFTSGAVAGTIAAGTGLGSSFGVGSITLALSVPVVAANGGTGLTSVGTAGKVLTSTGSAWSSAAPAYVPIPFNTVAASTQALAVNNSYYSTYAGICVMTLPASAAVGSEIEFITDAAGHQIKLAQNSGQLIYDGAQNGASVVTITGTGGYLQTKATSPNTVFRVKCIVANTTWEVIYANNEIDWN